MLHKNAHILKTAKYQVKWIAYLKSTLNFDLENIGLVNFAQNLQSKSENDFWGAFSYRLFIINSRMGANSGWLPNAF